MNPEIILLILGMMLVTYIPRALPAAFIDKFRFGKKMLRKAEDLVGFHL